MDPVSSGRNVKILLVEDNEDIREGLTDLLESEGYSVVGSGTAEDGLARLRSESFHMVITAEETGAYKPQMKGFEYMLDKLGCGPEDITHVSSSFRYDLMTAYDMGIKSKVWVNRGHEPANPFYEYTEIKDIGGLAAAVGL